MASPQDEIVVRVFGADCLVNPEQYQGSCCVELVHTGQIDELGYAHVSAFQVGPKISAELP